MMDGLRQNIDQRVSVGERKSGLHPAILCGSFVTLRHLTKINFLFRRARAARISNQVGIALRGNGFRKM